MLVNTDYIVEYGTELDYEKLKVEKNNTKSANATIEDASKRIKYKSLINGTLYYKSKDNKPNTNTPGDIRITYFKMIVKNKISIIGEKYGKEIIPSTDIKGLDSYRIFRVVGKALSYDGFMEIIRKEGRSVYIAFQVISILLLFIGMPLMVWGCLDVKGQCRNQLR